MKMPAKLKRSTPPALAPPNRDRARPGARRHLRASCERCRSKDNLQAHHLDGNWRNNAKGNIVTLCATCHSNFHAGRWHGAPGALLGKDGKPVPVRWVGGGMTATPLPRKSMQALSYAAAWGARQRLEQMIELAQEGDAWCGGVWAADWRSMKRRFFISVDDNERLQKLYIAACRRVEVVPWGSAGFVARHTLGLAWLTPAEWYAKHGTRVKKLRKLAMDEEERWKQAAGAGSLKKAKGAQGKQTR